MQFPYFRIKMSDSPAILDDSADCHPSQILSGCAHATAACPLGELGRMYFEFLLHPILCLDIAYYHVPRNTLST